MHYLILSATITFLAIKSFLSFHFYSSMLKLKFDHQSFVKFSAELKLISTDDVSLYPATYAAEDFLSREYSTGNLSIVIESMFKINSLFEARKRVNFPVIFASGIAGIGKTLFGQLAPREISKSNLISVELRDVLSKMNYLMMDFNAGGDQFSDADILLSVEERFLIRVLARACRISNGVTGLRHLLFSAHKASLDLHIQEMKKGGLTNVANQLCRYENGAIPTMTEILLAIATDVRIASGNDRERVGIWLHVDEHQLFYNDVKIKLQLNDDLSLEEHKNLLAPAI